MKKEENLIAKNYIEPIILDLSNEPNFDFPTEMIPIDDADATGIYNQSKKIVSMIVVYKELMMMYTCAMKQIRTKFEILNTEFNVLYQRNPINFINTRLKSGTSIVEKMKRDNIPFLVENIEAYINDVAGIRVICSYVDDIYLISQALIKQGDVTLIEKKDYIANPKLNGYRSMHLIVSIPVFFADQTKLVKVEVQIRTIAMDFWATLEHQLKYKHRAINAEEITAELTECACIIADTDCKMREIRKKIEASADEQTEDDVLFEKLRKFDLAIEQSH